MAKRQFLWVIWSASLLFIVFIFFAAQLIFERFPSPLNFKDEAAKGFRIYAAPKKNLWSDLDDDEFQDVLQFLYTTPNSLNLTRVGNATA
jgi:hypothetical protein